MTGPGTHWIAGAVELHNAAASYDVPGERLALIVTENETRRVVIRVTNPHAAATTVRLELRPDVPDGPGSPVKVSARSLRLGAQATDEFVLAARVARFVLSVRLQQRSSGDPRW